MKEAQILFVITKKTENNNEIPYETAPQHTFYVIIIVKSTNNK